MKKFSLIAALAAALVSISSVPTPTWADSAPSLGHCQHLQDMWEMYQGAHRVDQFPKRDRVLLEQCRQKKQQVSQPAAQPKRVGLGWMFR
jgi:hypothetical protein